MASLKSHLALLLLAPALVSCQFSFSSGGLDHAKLESSIKGELDGLYSEIGRQVSTVECPRDVKTPKPGETFICNVDVDNQNVRVEVKVNDDDYNADFSTLDVVFDLADTAKELSREISAEYGFAVTVTCGEGLEVVAVGDSFECNAIDRSGDSRVVKVTAGAVGEDDSWEVLE